MHKSTSIPSDGSHELLFAGPFNLGRGYAFPCDAEGHLDSRRAEDDGVH